MKLSKRQFCIAVNTYKTMLEEEQKIVEALDVGPEWKGAEWIENYYDLLTDMCELAEDPYIGTDLDWFCNDADFGRRSDWNKIYEPKTNHTWVIDTPQKLYDYIMGND